MQTQCLSCHAEQQRKLRSTVEGCACNLLCQARIRARSKSIDFSIDSSWVASQLRKPCGLTGVTFDLRTGVGYKPFGPSIDRINNNEGYIEGNVRVVPFCYNQGKRDFTELDFIAMCVAVAERHADRPEVVERLKELRDGKF